MSDDPIAALVRKLGITDKAARELIEIGEPALAAVDAVAADASRPMEAQRAALLVAQRIRERRLKVPPTVGLEPCADGEARELLAQGARICGDTSQRHDARTFVDRLYASGATRVTVTDCGSVLLVDLPADPAARERLFALYNAEVDELGEEFGGEEPPGHEMTREEALAIDTPDAEGEWVVDDLHATDIGQAVLRFWWD